MKQKIRNLDEAFLFSVQRNQSKELSVLMIAFSLIGNGGLLWFIVTAFLIFNPQTSLYGLNTLVSLGFCALVNNIILKFLFSRDRPCDIHSNVPLLIKRPIGSSLPSGHAATSFSCVIPLMAWDVRLGLIALLIALIIAFSRLYLFVHYPSDVIFGIIIGLTSGAIGILIVKLFLFIIPIPYFMI